MRYNMQEHTPDPSKLPKSVIGWQQVDNKRLWNDGTQILAAVPVHDDRWPTVGWLYEFSVVVIRCDEGLFELETPDGDPWGWDLDSIDYYAILTE